LSDPTYAPLHEDLWGSGGIAPRINVEICVKLHALTALPQRKEPPAAHLQNSKIDNAGSSHYLK